MSFPNCSKSVTRVVLIEKYNYFPFDYDDAGYEKAKLFLESLSLPLGYYVHLGINHINAIVYHANDLRKKFNIYKGYDVHEDIRRRYGNQFYR